MSVWVLKSHDDKYLAPTVFSKFSHVSMGDLVPEQVYALRYYDRNTAAAMCVRLNGGCDNDRWRLVRLRSTSALPGPK